MDITHRVKVVAKPIYGICRHCGSPDLGINMNWNHIDGYGCWNCDTIRQNLNSIEAKKFSKVFDIWHK